MRNRVSGDFGNNVSFQMHSDTHICRYAEGNMRIWRIEEAEKGNEGMETLRGAFLKVSRIADVVNTYIELPKDLAEKIHGLLNTRDRPLKDF